jgi:hypothetical protein
MSWHSGQVDSYDRFVGYSASHDAGNLIADYGGHSSVTSGGGASSGSVYVAGSNLRQVPNIPLEQYTLNVDPNPTIVRKKQEGRISLVQNVSLKYLKPPQPEQPGDITITQEPDVQAPAAPPLVVKQPAPAALQQQSIVIRERPPQPPQPIGPKHITIPGRVLPPPPRQVITERLAPQPAAAGDILIERWLGYGRRTRNVIFRPAAPLLAPARAEKNLLIEWEAADVDLRQEFKFLGVQEADPRSYLAQHGNSVVDSSRLPREAAQFAVPAGHVLGVDSNPNDVPTLRGAVQALRNVNLSCEGLSEYANQV